MEAFRIIIPARYESTRFPGKALADINGKPMIQHVYERALECKGAASVVIATDDKRIEQAAKKFGAEVCMTSDQHQTGTDRLAEAASSLRYADNDIVVNVQGDEPLISPSIIEQVAFELSEHPSADVATLCAPIETADQLFAPNFAKIILDKNNFALYFSRAPIPWDRDNFPLKDDAYLPPHIYFKHVGIYSYRVKFLKRFIVWRPCIIESLEKLEQLRMIYYGAKIYAGVAKVQTAIGVDTPEDLEKVLEFLSELR